MQYMAEELEQFERQKIHSLSQQPFCLHSQSLLAILRNG
jgi:hypothetical protein